MMARKIYKYPMMRFFLGAMAMLILVSCQAVDEGAKEQTSFSSPQEAVSSLVAALQDNNDANLLAILGPGSGDLISSGDKVVDQNDRMLFLKAYQEKTSREKEDEGHEVLLVGSKDYPFPFPIIKQGDAWFFNTQAGREEILNRRIGSNELHTIEVMSAYIDAQREYGCINRSGEGSEFAQKFASSEGKKDGLYWEVGEGDEESPFGPLIAWATEDGYTGNLDEPPPEPFHGYYFKILKAQGEHAKGGAFDYVANGKMVLGFALIAYPAKYGALGIMTFIVNQEGVIYEKDLGEDTAMAAAAMTTFDPDSAWRKHEEPAEK